MSTYIYVLVPTEGPFEIFHKTMLLLGLNFSREIRANPILRSFFILLMKFDEIKREFSPKFNFRLETSVVKCFEHVFRSFVHAFIDKVFIVELNTFQWTKHYTSVVKGNFA